MLSALRVKLSQGRQYIIDVRRAVPHGFVGLPSVASGACEATCSRCRDVCPTAAITLDPVQLDLGKCVFCRECVSVCPTGKLSFSSEVKMAASVRDGLLVRSGDATPPAVAVSAALQKMFGRSLKLRSVSAGGCNGCELELNAAANVNFDFGRFGIDWVASPRHADALVLSGPLTRNMAAAVDLAYAGMPDPKFVIAFGACAISGGLYAASPALDRKFLERFTPSLYVPGCPPHPLTFVNGLLDLLGIGLR
jgi:Ni,Fe-hydrogenase III small subunit/ferredoxin